MKQTLFAATAALLSAMMAASALAQDSGGGKKPLDAVNAAEKGQLQNPFKDDKAAAEAGHKLYMSAGCNGCHGGTGGGGMGPPLTNAIWIYGKDEDTLYRLITLGSQELQAKGYTRKGSESVKGPMPPFKDIVKSDEDLWKIVTWITSLSAGK
ncbi:MAG: c-type cytochrome [Hyphomicrobiaceae bacterium]|nr:c-type cytochrome [Hyphomicrobiaceae bacterium]